jgi:hypothetical protein
MKHLIAILLVALMAGCAGKKELVRHEVVVQTKYVPVAISQPFLEDEEKLPKVDAATATQKDAAAYLAEMYGQSRARSIKLGKAREENAQKLTEIEELNRLEEERVRAIVQPKKD